MNAKDFFKQMIEDAGYDEATAAILMKAAENDKVANRVASLKQQSEYDAVQTRAQALERELEGSNGQPGTKAYAKWYQDNYAQIQKLAEEKARYEERYGPLNGQGQPAASAAAPALTEDALAKMVDARIQGQYAPRWTDLLKGSGKLIERHMKNKRSQDIDWDKISEIAATKNGDLVAAYDEWDAPEREKQSKADEESRFQSRMQKEREKWQQEQTAKAFPAGADGTPSDSPLFRKNDTARTDANTRRQKLLEVATTGNYDGYAGVNGEAGKNRPANGFFSN